MSSYEKYTAHCVILYFNDARTDKKGDGRYLQIPNPNTDTILQWANLNNEYNPGSYMAYTQYQHTRGVKIQVFGNTAESADQMRNLLETFTNFKSEELYFRAPARLCTPKLELKLKLVRITLFPDNSRQKDGRKLGTILWENGQKHG